MDSRLPTLWRARSKRAAAVPMLLGAAVLIVLAVVVSSALLPRLPTGAAVLALLAAALPCGVAAVFWFGEREAARVRRALAAGISHQMRTPLTQIRMFTEMLLMQHERSEEERIRWLETIERETHLLGDVMENLLLFVHGDEPDPFPARRPTDLGALVEDVAVGFARRAAARRMRIEARPAAGIAASVDSQAMRRAVGNLLDNALRYGPAGQTVTVTVEPGGDGHAVIRVADEGPGIPAADRRQVWQPFVRLDGTAAAEGGSGLGLAVVRRVAEAHGGRSWIDEGSGAGALLCISLPTVPADALALPPPADAPVTEALQPTQG